MSRRARSQPKADNHPSKMPTEWRSRALWPRMQRFALAEAMTEARALRRRHLGFAAACAIVRTSDHDRLDRALTAAIDPEPRATTVAAFLAAAGAPHVPGPGNGLRMWARGLGTGRSGLRRARNPGNEVRFVPSLRHLI